MLAHYLSGGNGTLGTIVFGAAMSIRKLVGRTLKLSFQLRHKTCQFDITETCHRQVSKASQGDFKLRRAVYVQKCLRRHPIACCAFLGPLKSYPAPLGHTRNCLKLADTLTLITLSK